MRGRKKKSEQYSPELWSCVESLFRTGQFNSIEKLHIHCTKLFPKLPCLDSFKQRFAKKGIKKTDLKPIITNEIEKLTIDLFAERGLPKEEVVDRIIAGITCADKVRSEIVEICKTAIESGASAISQESVAAINKLFERMGMQHTYIRTYLELTGLFAPKKIDHTNKGEAFVGTDYRNMPEDELSQRFLARLDRLKKLAEYAPPK
jgi:hypothetical protein